MKPIDAVYSSEKRAETAERLAQRTVNVAVGLLAYVAGHPKSKVVKKLAAAAKRGDFDMLRRMVGQNDVSGACKICGINIYEPDKKPKSRCGMVGCPYESNVKYSAADLSNFRALMNEQNIAENIKAIAREGENT